MVKRKIIVLGRGGSAVAAMSLADSLGYETLSVEGDDSLPPKSFDFAVASPGIAPDHRWFTSLRERNIEVISELQFGLSVLKRNGWRILAVTGSKGKSSVVKVIADALSLSGEKAVACGNYGLPVSEVALSSDVGWAVAEVSSFMMETTALAGDFFEAACILNLQSDHLDRHGDIQTYHALKMKLMSMTKNPFVPPFSPAPLSLVAEKSYFGSGVLRENAAAAIAMMRACSLEDDIIKRSFDEFVPLAHRMQKIASVDGVDYIDDSKATSIDAMIAAVGMIDTPVRLIAGGLPKGDDPAKALAVLTKRVKKVYIIGRSAELFSAAWSHTLECEICVTMENAVEAVKHEARRGETVLLSPGAASYDQFENFVRRGEVFASLVK